MKKLTLFIALISAGIYAHSANAGENLPRKLSAAETVINNLDPKGALLRGMPSAQSNPMLAKAVENMDFRKINDHILNMMMAVFSEDELVALAAFQESPEGKSVQQKMPKFQQFIGAKMQDELNKAMQNTVGISPQGTLKENPYQMR